MTDHDPYGEPTRADIPVTDPTLAVPATPGGRPPAGPPPTGRGPVPPPPDRRPWIIGGIVVLILLVGLALLLAGDDEDETSTTDTTGTTTVEETTTTEAPATTTTEAPATTTTAAPTTTTTSPPSTVAPGLCTSSEPDDPDTTAQVVYQAFTLDDRECAANLATEDAVDQLFSISGRGGGWSFAGCFDQEEPDPHTQCSFTFDGGSTSFRMRFSDTDGWVIYEVFQVAD